jgi:hypothetical protein
MTQHDWVDWHELERRIPLDELPVFHRAFLKTVRPEEHWEDAPLRQVQGKVQASLKGLERSGFARTEGERLLVAGQFIPLGFEQYLEDPDA